jgi:hypothetical protein
MTPVTPLWTLAPGLDPALIALLALVLLALAIREAWRAPRMSLLRFSFRLAAILFVAALLAGPSRWTASTEPVKPRVALLIDRSRSMSLRDDDAGCPRLAAVKQSWLTLESRSRLAAVVDASLHSVAETTQPLSITEIDTLAPAGDRSRLTAGLATFLPSRPGSTPVDLVLLSDGVDTEGALLSSLAPAAKNAGVVIHAVVPSGGGGPGDTRLDASFDESWIVTGEKATLRVDIAETSVTGAPARLIIRERDFAGPVIAERTLSLGPRQTVEIPILPPVEPAIEAAALARYVAVLEPQPGEAVLTNNRDTAAVQVMPKRLRVVLFEAEPSWDTRSFADALAADPDVELTAVYRLATQPEAPGDRARLRVTRITPGLERTHRTTGSDAPITPDALDAFDLFVLGRGAATILPAEAAAHLRTLVEARGRALLMLRGPELPPSPLGWASPFLGRSGTVTLRWPTLRPAEADLTAPILKLSELRCTLGALKPAAIPLVFADRSPAEESVPVLIESRVGAGRIGTVAAEGLWRAGVSGEAARDSVRRLWTRWVTRLVYGSDVPPGASALLALTRLEAAPNEPITAVVRTRHETLDLSGVPLTIRRPDGVESTVALTRDADSAAKWTASIRSDLEGDHHVRLRLPPAGDHASPMHLETMLSVKVRDLEMLETTPRREDLRSLAERTGGRLWAPTPSAAEDFAEYLERRAVARTVPPRLEPLWDRGWLYVALCALLAAEWWLRRREGLA